jgi:hypothetical protein
MSYQLGVTALKNGLEPGFDMSGDAGLPVVQSPSPVLPQSSLAKATKSGVTLVNLPPSSPLPKGFIPSSGC